MNHITTIKPMTKTELANAYGINIRTFNKWIKPLASKLGKINGRLYTPAQLNIIFEAIGKPF